MSNTHTPRIAILVPAFALGGGVPSVAIFIHQVLSGSNRYHADVISLATSAYDESSVRLLSPPSWLHGIKVTDGMFRGIPYRHVGAFLTEFEFQRYQPRRLLTEILNQYDLVQVVAGTPAWAYATRDVQCPVCLFTATTIEKERVSMLRQLGWKRYWTGTMTLLNSTIEKAVLKKVSCVFAESEYTRKSVQSLVPEARLFLGAPGVDTDVFSSPLYHLDGYILSVGRFSDPRKNIRLLFDAYDQVLQNIPEAPRLILAGTSPRQEDWEYAETLGITKYIEIQPNVSQEQLADLYRGASLFVLSSNEEGLGIVILEAMASGLPVVSTDCGGPATAVREGETGYLTPVGDAATMADAIHRLLENPSLRQRMGQQGRKVAEDRFSLATVGKVFLDQYDALLNKK